jgi:hypothetical protein
MKEKIERLVAFVKANMVAISWNLTISFLLFYCVMLIIGGD